VCSVELKLNEFGSPKTTFHRKFILVVNVIMKLAFLLYRNQKLSNRHKQNQIIYQRKKSRLIRFKYDYASYPSLGRLFDRDKFDLIY
jgi:hypothetical protein